MRNPLRPGMAQEIFKMPVQYKARNGAQQFMPTVEEAAELDQLGEGFCLACGNTQLAEPDARKYVCDACEAPKVYGIAELALMGLVSTEGDEE